jgi:hypothetical protein
MQGTKPYSFPDSKTSSANKIPQSEPFAGARGSEGGKDLAMGDATFWEAAPSKELTMRSPTACCGLDQRCLEGLATSSTAT